jgi:hypothetical protein
VSKGDKEQATDRRRTECRSASFFLHLIGSSRHPPRIQQRFLDLLGEEAVFSNMVEITLIPVKHSFE